MQHGSIAMRQSRAAATQGGKEMWKKGKTETKKKKKEKKRKEKEKII